MPDLTNIYGWDGTQWVAILVNAAGKLIIDPTEILEDTPTDGQVAKAPTSNWAHDHALLPDVHHVAFVAADHTAIGNGAPHHAEAHTLASHTTKAHSELTGIGASDHHVRYADSEALAAVAGAGYAKIAAGGYTGTGTQNRDIAHGLGIIPKIVLLIDKNYSVFYRIFGAYGCLYYESGSSHGGVVVTIPDSVNFYVGDATLFLGNTDTHPFYWVAMG